MYFSSNVSHVSISWAFTIYINVAVGYVREAGHPVTAHCLHECSPLSISSMRQHLLHAKATQAHSCTHTRARARGRDRKRGAWCPRIARISSMCSRTHTHTLLHPFMQRVRFREDAHTCTRARAPPADDNKDCFCFGFDFFVCRPFHQMAIESMLCVFAGDGFV